MKNDVFDGHGVYINLPNPKNFTMVMETLTRVGYPSKVSKTLYQSCHIFHKRGQYAIMHFKEMFYFDNKPVDITEEDTVRRNSIVQLLEQWKLIEVDDVIDTPFSLDDIVIVPFQEKNTWNLIPKYQVGAKREGRNKV